MPQPPQIASRVVRRLAQASALLGGAVMLAVALAVTASVALRELTGGGIRGDFELVVLACAVCAFLFMPICQLERRHVRVDVFSGFLPRRGRRGLDRCWEGLFALAWAALGLRMLDGAVELYGYDQRTMLLRLPLWLVYVPALFGAALSLVAAAHNALAPDDPDADIAG